MARFWLLVVGFPRARPTGGSFRGSDGWLFPDAAGEDHPEEAQRSQHHQDDSPAVVVPSAPERVGLPVERDLVDRFVLRVACDPCRPRSELLHGLEEVVGRRDVVVVAAVRELVVDVVAARDREVPRAHARSHRLRWGTGGHDEPHADADHEQREKRAPDREPGCTANTILGRCHYGNLVAAITLREREPIVTAALVVLPVAITFAYENRCPISTPRPTAGPLPQPIAS